MPLVVVPTPIGNLEDITLRALRALREADVIACEDTRRTVKLLNHYEIKKPLVSYHRHNEKSRAEELISRVESGESVALVSDAGTPGISDPGYILIQKTLEKRLPLDVLPGPNAILPALLLSGIAPSPFTFVGFLEGREGEKKRRLESLAKHENALVFYIAPHALARDISFIEASLGDRQAAIVREISKIHQETIRGALGELAALAEQRTLKGEIVLVVEGQTARDGCEADESEWKGEAIRLKSEGIFVKNIAKMLSSRYGIACNRVKAFLLREENSDDYNE